MQLPRPAYRPAISALQLAKYQRRQHRHSTQHPKCLVNSVGLARKRSGRNAAVTSDAVAAPKLIDICCRVLAIELAALACSSVTSAYTSVFMLVYCNEVKKP